MLDDTLVYYIIGDNGASAEGTLNGTFNEMLMLNGIAALETPEFMALEIDEFGGAGGLQPLRRGLGARHGHALPVDQAGRLALGRHAQRHDRPLAERHQGKGEIRTQFHHVIDVAPTVLEAAGLPEPMFVNGVQQKPMRGRQHGSTRSTTPTRTSGTRRSTSRCSSTAASTTRAGPRSRGTATPWVIAPTAGVRRRRLGAVRTRRLDAGARPRRREPGQAARAAAALPDRGGQVQRAAARRPPRRALQRRHGGPPAAHQGQAPAAVRRDGAAHRELGPRASRTSRTRSRRRSRCPSGGAEGVIIAQGGAFGGWSLYAKDGKPSYCYNFFGLKRFNVDGETRDPAGRAPGPDGVRVRRRRPRQGRHRHPLPRRRQGRRGPRRATVPMVFSADETTDVGSRQRHPRQPRLRPNGTTRSPGGSTGCRSTSTRRRGPCHRDTGVALVVARLSTYCSRSATCD